MGFAIAEMMARRAWVCLLLVAACHRGAKTPDEAFLQVERSVAAGDGVTLYKFLDRATRGSVDSAYHDQQLMRTIILAKYPDEEQARALQPLAAAAEPDSAHYFAQQARERSVFDRFRRRLGSVSGPIAHKPDGEKAMWVARQDGMPLHFVLDSDGSWGFSELGADWALEKDRANHAVKTVRDNAALYKRAE
jgi:hypothetical protein